MGSADGRVIALDVGSKRIGVASAGLVARIPQPLTTLLVDDGDPAGQILKVLTDEKAVDLVVGLPRGLDGQETDQTRAVQAFIAELEPKLSIPLHWQDEALTSHISEEELGKRKGGYQKADVDALAACYILDDFLKEYDGAAKA